MAGRPILALVSLFFVSAAVVLLFFVILSGAISSSAVNHVYFLQADTSGISGASAQTQWTLWNHCNGGTTNTNCSPVKAAYPFDPPRNFFTTDKLDPFNGTKKYYYLSRFSFAFYLIALFFTACAFFTGFLALCTRIGGGLSGMLTAIALFFDTLAATLMTACFVEGRDAFRSLNRSANLGRYGFGLTWASFACLFVATILFCMVCTTRKETYSSKPKPSRFGRFGRRRSGKRGSFIDGDS